MAGELEQLAYELASRALKEQDGALDELRSRTGTLLAAAALVASFLGARSLDNVGFNWATVVALAAFAATALLSVYVLFPRQGLARSLSGPAVYEYFVAKDVDVAETRRQLAYWMQDAYAGNLRLVNRLFWGFRMASAALVLEVVFWSVALGLD